MDHDAADQIMTQMQHKFAPYVATHQGLFFAESHADLAHDPRFKGEGGVWPIQAQKSGFSAIGTCSMSRLK